MRSKNRIPRNKGNLNYIPITPSPPIYTNRHKYSNKNINHNIIQSIESENGSRGYIKLTDEMDASSVESLNDSRDMSYKKIPSKSFTVESVNDSCRKSLVESASDSHNKKNDYSSFNYMPVNDNTYSIGDLCIYCGDVVEVKWVLGQKTCDVSRSVFYAIKRNIGDPFVVKECELQILKSNSSAELSTFNHATSLKPASKSKNEKVHKRSQSYVARRRNRRRRMRQNKHLMKNNLSTIFDIDLTTCCEEDEVGRSFSPLSFDSQSFVAMEEARDDEVTSSKIKKNKLKSMKNLELSLN